MGLLMQTQRLGKSNVVGQREEGGSIIGVVIMASNHKAPKVKCKPQHVVAAFGRQGIPEADADGDGDGADGTGTLQNDRSSPCGWHIGSQVNQAKQPAMATPSVMAKAKRRHLHIATNTVNGHHHNAMATITGMGERAAAQWQAMGHHITFPARRTLPHIVMPISSHQQSPLMAHTSRG